MNNYNTNNSANINMILENKILKNDEICLTDENQIKNINNIKVCKIIEIKNEENKKFKNFIRNKSCKKAFGLRESIRENKDLLKKEVEEQKGDEEEEEESEEYEEEIEN